MTTLIAIRNSDGCIGRCDSRCYMATKNECGCICQGINHGVGFDIALANTKKFCDDWIKKHKRQNPGGKLKYKINNEVKQMSFLMKREAIND